MKELNFKISSAICMMPITRAKCTILGNVIPFYWLIGVRTSLRIWDQDNPTRSFQKVNFPSAGSSTFHYIQSWTELNPQTKRVPFGCEENKTSRDKTLLLNY